MGSDESKLDGHSRHTWEFVRAAIDRWRGEIDYQKTHNIPHPKKRVRKLSLTEPFPGLVVPESDEDLGKMSFISKIALHWLNHKYSINDMMIPWEDVEGSEKLIQAKLGNYLPRWKTKWKNVTTDTTIERLAFQGIGAHRLERSPDPETKEDGYAVKCDFMRKYDVRPGYTKYGGDAHFDCDGNLTHIILHGKKYTSDSKDWEHVKFSWRSSLFILVTVADHLIHTHMVVANYVSMAARTRLPHKHKLRRFLKAFSFRAGVTNSSATYSLFPEKGLVHRTAALEYDELVALCKYVVKHIRYKPYIEELKSLMSLKEMERLKFYFGIDAIKLWNIVEKFVRGYLEHHFEGQKDKITDKHILSWLREIKKRAQWWLKNVKLRNFDMDCLVKFVTHFIFCSTGLHEHVGMVMQYLMDPRFVAGRWRKGDTECSYNNSFQMLFIACLTDMQLPPITGTFAHLLPQDAHTQGLHATFHSDLWDLVEDIEESNNDREIPLFSFDPRYLEISVSM